jgi:hypothetical protein
MKKIKHLWDTYKKDSFILFLSFLIASFIMINIDWLTNSEVLLASFISSKLLIFIGGFILYAICVFSVYHVSFFFVAYLNDLFEKKN